MQTSICCAARAPSCLSPQPAARSSQRPSRRQFLQQLLRVGAVSATTSVTASVVGSLLSHDDHEQEFDLEAILGAAAAPQHQQQREQQPLPAAAARRSASRPMLVAQAVRPHAAAAHGAPGPRVLELHNGAVELAHLLACHPHRLLVVHFAAAGCPLGEAFLPALTSACTRYPAALFLRITLQPEQAAQADTQEVLQGLRIGRLPCTLLLRGQQLLARLEVCGPSSGSLDKQQQPADAAATVAAAAQTLQAAVAAALHLAVAEAEGEAPPAAAAALAAPHLAFAVAP